MYKKLGKKNLILNIHLLLVYIFIFRCMGSGIANIPFFSITLALYCGILWYVIAIFKHKEFLKESIGFLILYIIWFLLCFIRNYAHDGTFQYFYEVVFILTASVFLYYCKYEPEHKKGIAIVTLAGFFATMLATFAVLKYDPLASRKAAAGTIIHYTGFFTVGSFDFIYGTIFIILGLLFCIKNKWINKIFGYITLALSIYCVIVSQYATAVVLLLVVIIGYILLINNKKFLLFLCGILGIIILLFGISSINDAILNFINTLPNILKERLIELYNYLNGLSVDDSSTMLGRSEIRKQTVNAILKHPFFGIKALELNESRIIGVRHSQWLADIYEYGLIQITILCGFIAVAIKRIKLYTPNTANFRKLLLLCFIYFLLLGWLNPCIYNQIYMPLFLFIPFISSFEKNKEIESTGM